MDSLVSSLQGLFAGNIGLAAFLVGFLEEIFFIVPSSLIFLAAGFLAVDPGLSFWEALSVVLLGLTFWGALGVTIGSFFIYGVFYWGGKLMADKYGKYLGIKWDEIEKIERKFSAGHTDEFVVFFLRAIPIWSITIVSAFAGVIRLSWKTFAIYTLLGTAVRITVLGMVGWSLGEAYQLFADKLDKWELIGTIVLALVMIIGSWYLIKWQIKKDKMEDDGE